MEAAIYSDITERLGRTHQGRSETTSLSGSTFALDDHIFNRTIWPGVDERIDNDDTVEFLIKVGMVDEGSLHQSRRHLQLGEDLLPTHHLQSSVTESASSPPSVSTPTARRRHSPPSLAAAPPSHTNTPTRPLPQTPIAPGAPQRPRAENPEDKDNPFADRFHKFIHALSAKTIDSSLGEEDLGGFLAPYIATWKIAGTIPRAPLPKHPAFNMGQPKPVLPDRGGSLPDLLLGLTIGDSLPVKLPGRILKKKTKAGNRTAAPDVKEMTEDETTVTVMISGFVTTLLSPVRSAGGYYFLEPRRVQYQCAAGPFNAAVDGILESKKPMPVSPNLKDKKPLRVLFLCEFKRVLYDLLKGKVELQEAAQAAAFIANLHAVRLDAGGENVKPEGGYVLVLSQYYLELFLTLAEYGPGYVAHVSNPNSPVLPPAGAGEDHFLSMRRIGRYHCNKPMDMYQLSHLLLALAIKDARETRR